MEIIKKTTDTTHTWADLKKAVADGSIRELVNSGDMIPMPLKNGEAVELVASYDESGKLFFVPNNCIKRPMSMNVTNTNNGGWAASQMRARLNSVVLSLLPDELREVIAPTRIMQIFGDGESVSEDYLFLLSRTQVFGYGEWSSYEPDDSPLDIFHCDRSRIKERDDCGTEWWWLRSPIPNSDEYFTLVDVCGDYSTSFSSFSHGVVPCFCL